MLTRKLRLIHCVLLVALLAMLGPGLVAEVGRTGGGKKPGFSHLSAGPKGVGEMKSTSTGAGGGGGGGGDDDDS
ncbi:MAG: hypothetical protein AB1486_12705 [Planctomycetota bacterium]